MIIFVDVLFITSKNIMEIKDSKDHTLQLVDKFYDSNLVAEKQDIAKQIKDYLKEINTLDDSMLGLTIESILLGHIEAYNISKIKMNKNSIISSINRFYSGQI